MGIQLLVVEEADAKEAYIRVHDLSLTYSTERGPVRALSDLSFDIQENEFVSIIGPSGCGKSTLLKLVSDLIPPTAGEISIAHQKPRVLRRNKQVGFLFQDSVLLPWKSVLDNVTFLISMARKDCDVETAIKLLDLVGLGAFVHNLPHELSGGMKQRVSIARALMLDPLVLLMDEPFGALDEITREKMNLELLRIWTEQKKTVVFVTHSISEAVFLSDRVIVLTARPGRIQSIVDIDLPRPRTIEMRYSSRATNLVRELHNALELAEREGIDS